MIYISIMAMFGLMYGIGTSNSVLVILFGWITIITFVGEVVSMENTYND